MFNTTSTGSSTNLVDQAAAAANKGIAATQHALDGVAGSVQTLRDQVSPRLDDATASANAMVHRGVDALRDTSQLLREKAHQASAGTTHYIQREPVKAVLIAAATGAVLLALIGWLTRPRHQG